ncbi:MAG TPA: AI-2E family transporter [Thermomicrobiales bacterium]|nr:AI-2E family transporter [Thermomicrobiales bacterium]
MILTLVIIWLVVRLWPVLLQLIIAVMLTAALWPAVSRLQRRGLPRSAAVLVILAALVGVVSLVLLILVPPLIVQGEQFAKEFPENARRVELLVRDNSALVDRLRQSASGSTANPTALLSGFLRFGAGILQGISTALIVLVLTVYLLVDGERILAWSMRYLPVKQRVKVRRALPEISRVVSGYVIGQALTSLLFGVFAFTVLSIVGVPQPLLLAIVAAFADAIPIAGVFIATVPATGLALTVSVPAAIVVFALYVAYQQVENYLIVPRVYRGTLQISSFAVLVAVLIGAQLLGVIGVLLALPIAAAIPVVERIWTEDEATAAVYPGGGS